MKSTGIVRKLDPLGRIVLPIEIRRKLNIACDDGLEVFTDNDRIIFRKYEPACVFCGSNDEVSVFKGKKICKACCSTLETPR